MTFKKGDNTHQKKKRNSPDPPPPIKLGRPSVYQDGFPEIVKRLRLLSMTKDEIAQFFGVDDVTIDLWLSKHELFNSAYNEGGPIADADVAVALRHRAIGYSHPAEKIFLGPGGQVIRAEYIQHYPPETAAAGLWLANRQKAKWALKDRDRDTGDGDANTITIVGGLPDE